MTDNELARAICAELRAEHRKPICRFTLEEGEPDIFSSKVDGVPYLPRDMSWPLDSQGHPLALLAQIDCADLMGLADLPTAGLLQFFVGQDDVYGMDFHDETSQADFRVLYHETPDPSVTREEVTAKRPAWDEERYGEAYTPVGTPMRMVFSPPEEAGIVPGDYRFPALFVQRWNERRPDAPLRSYWEVCSRQPEGQKDYEIFEDPDQRAPSHQVGGWPFFTQNDPRTPEEHPDFEILLFQLDSEMRDRKDLVLWGDCGVGGFFIRPEDLRARDFSRVMYNWDCG